MWKGLNVTYGAQFAALPLVITAVVFSLLNLANVSLSTDLVDLLDYLWCFHLMNLAKHLRHHW